MELTHFLDKEREDFIEKGAALEHARWARWQSYLHSKCTALPDGSLVIPKELADRWTHQISRDYKHLTDQEKESDRKEVREYLHWLKAHDERVIAHVRNLIEAEHIDTSSPHNDALYSDIVMDRSIAINSTLSRILSTLPTTQEEQNYND